MEGGENAPPAEKIYVAVGTDMLESVSALKWALDNYKQGSIILLHVQIPIRYIPSPMGNIPVSKARNDVLNAHRYDEQEKLNDCMNVYLEICSGAKVNAEPLVVEKADVCKGIVEVVSELGIRKLVMGTTSASCTISKRMKLQGPGKADYVQRHSIESCEVFIICKGKLVLAQNPTSYRTPLNQLICERPQMSVCKLCSVQSSPSPSFTPNVQLDFVSSFQTPVKGESNKAALPEELNGPGFESSLDIKPATEQLCSESEDLHSRHSQSDDGRCNTNHESEAGRNLSATRTSEESEELHREIETLKLKLREALEDAFHAKREALIEIQKRQKEEMAAIKAIRRFKEHEAAFKEAAKEKEDASSLLRITKHRCEEITRKRDEAMEELETIGQKLKSLERQVNESSQQRHQKMQELEVARRKIAALEEQNHRIVQEKDAAVKQLQDYHDSRRGIETATSVSSNNLEFMEYSFDDIKISTSNFSLEFKLGEGGYGTVYKGELKQTFVAVKIRRDNNSLQGQKEFQREIDLLKYIRHPHLVRVTGACLERGCIVYEYMSNGSLADRLSCKNATLPLPWQTRFRIAVEVCSALHFLHSNKPDPIVHRDLKPQNILLDENYVSKISDFGIARILPEENSHSETELKGTFSYMDPEYLRSGEFSTKSDVYSVGVVILQLLTGKPAFGLVREVDNAMDSGNLKEVLDPSAGEWPSMQTTQLAYFALHCAESDRNKRASLEPDVMKFLDKLRDFAVAASNPLQRGYMSVQIAQEKMDPSFFLCPIFKEVMQNPYVAADGFTYEKEAIEGWFNCGHDTSPITNVKLHHMRLLPNHSLKAAIREWQEKGNFMYLTKK